MSTESQKSDSASESEENALEEYPARPPTPRLGPRAGPRAGPFREGFGGEQSSVMYTVPMTRSPTRTPAYTETEFSSDELVPPPSYRDIDIIEIYQRYQDMYRANYPDVSLIKNNLNRITMIVPFM